MLLFLEDRFLFRPFPYTREWDAPPNDRVHDVEWQLPAGPHIHAWWCPTENGQSAQGALLYFHGNSGNLSLCGESITRWQRELNASVLILDYPGYGRSTGRPSEAGCYAAADAAHDWLTGILHVPAQNILLYGGSLGCAVALDLASRRACRAVVLVSPFTSVRDMAQRIVPWLPRTWVRNRFDNLAKIGRCHRPVFLAHGTADRLVPFAQGQRLFDAANEPKEMLALEGYDHQHTPGPEFYRRVRAFVERTTPLPEAHDRAN